MKTVLRSIQSIVILLILANSIYAEENAPTISSKIDSVSMFKNGLGFVRREASLVKNNGFVVFDKLPIPIHGTYWVQPIDKDVGIIDLTAYMQETIEERTASTLPEFLEANIGEMVELKIGDTNVQCKLVSIPTNQQAKINQTAAFDRSSYHPQDAGSMILIQTDDKTFLINKSEVKRLGCTGKEIKTSIKRPQKTATIKMRVLDNRAKGKISVCYLAKGITWVPSCMIDVTDDKKVILSAKAEIINELEDLDNTTVNFITGFPNLQFSGVVDPIAMGGDIGSFFNALQNPQGSRRNAPTMSQRAVRVNAPVYGSEAVGPTYAIKALQGQMRDELFFYSQKGVTLKKGERGYYPLYTIEVPCEHVYEWKIGNTINANEQFTGTDPKKAADIWHNIRLTNIGSVPWTTAPVMIMKNGQISGQDTIYYTSPGAKTVVRITQSVDIKAEQMEYETGRKSHVASFYNHSYALVDIQGKLRAVSYKDKPITLIITKELSGEVVKSNLTASATQMVRGLSSVNQNCVLVWEIPMKAHDKAEIEYQYKAYVRD